MNHKTDYNPNHYRFYRVSNHHTPGWLFPPPVTGDRWVFWAIVLLCVVTFFL
jgi:hypothetical protein